MLEEKKIYINNEKGDCPEFREYLEKLSAEKNPFICPYLKVLPINITIKNYGDQGPPSRYYIGDLTCTGRKGVSFKCRGFEKPKINQEGNLEAKCDWPFNNIIILKLK
ncbi:MAG: hypothetical protein PHD81_00160 [Candidatus Nanoarchaeia archaeon]|nr:hypothetical protein [Candidatus Nanoarchaeia archaeon]MDD5587505.1 hypothetical protein [Candidatus Nanoarchaeia archaeon]